MQNHAGLLVAVGGLCLILSSYLVKLVLTRINPNALATRGLAHLDGLRGVLAFCVIAHHSYYNFTWREGGAWGAKSLTIVNLGAVAVSLFFMLSAYFHLHKIRTSPEINWREFYWARAKRIYPLYLVVFVVVLGITLAFRPVNGHDLFAFSWKWLLFQQTSYQGFQSHLIIAGVQWTLVYEWAVYMILPLFHMAYHRKITKQMVAWLAILLAIWVMWFHTHSRFLWIFLLAIPAVLCQKWIRNIFQAASKIVGLILVLLTVYVMLKTVPYSWEQRLLLCVLFAFMVNGFSYWQLLSHEGLVKIGEWSYAIYLLHGLILFMWFGVWQIFAFGHGQFVYYLAHLPLIFGASVILAFLANRYIEQWFWKKK